MSGDPDSAEEKQQTLTFKQVECAAFSFKSLARIDNLWGLTKLIKLQLDNNHLQKIENLSHLVRIPAVATAADTGALLEATALRGSAVGCDHETGGGWCF